MRSSYRRRDDPAAMLTASESLETVVRPASGILEYEASGQQGIGFSLHFFMIYLYQVKGTETCSGFAVPYPPLLSAPSAPQNLEARPSIMIPTVRKGVPSNPSSRVLHWERRGNASPESSGKICLPKYAYLNVTDTV